MRKNVWQGLLAIMLTGVLILSACTPAATATNAPTSAAAPTTAGTAAATPSPIGTPTTAATTAAVTGTPTSGTPSSPGIPTPTGTTAGTTTTPAAGIPTPTGTASGAVVPTAAATTASGTQVPLTFENVDPTGTTVTFWHQMTGSNAKALQAIVDAFNKTNQYKITVDAEAQGNYSDIYNKMINVLNTSDAPDLVVAYQNQAATYQLANALTDMRPLVNSPKWGLTASEQADFFPGFWQQDIFPSFGGARLGFPVYRSEEVLYYNADWLKELGFNAPPTTPDEFQQVVCKAAKQPFSKATGKGKSVGYEYYTGDASHFAAWTFAFGGNIFDGASNQYTFNSPAAQQFATFMQGLVKNGCVSLVAQQYSDQTDFGAGTTLFTTGSTSGLNFYAQAVDQGAKFSWSVAALPHTTPNPVMNIYGASLSIPKTNAKEELAAWLFLKYFGEPQNQAQFAEATGYYPVRSSSLSSMADYMAKNPEYKAGFDLLKYGTFEPPVPGYDAVRNELGTTISQILASPYPDPKPLLDKLNTDANANLKDQLSQMKK